MQSASADYKTAIAATSREIRGYLEFSNGFILSGSGGLISFKATQTAMEEERFCVGSVTSAYCEASFYNEGLNGSGVSLANSYFDAYCGVVTDPSNNTVEYICLGRFYISEITRSTATTRIVGYDIAGRLSMDYVPTVTKDPDHGYLVMDILNDIIDQTGVNGGTHFTTFGDSTYVAEIYQGNCKAQWGWLCTLVRSEQDGAEWSGNREPQDLGYIAPYYLGNGSVNPYAMTDDVVYLDGLNVGDSFTIDSFTTGTSDTPIVSGNGVGVVGLNPYIDQATADAIFANLDNFTYTPVTLHWRGDPCLDVMDKISITTGAGTTYSTVAMKIVTTFNGGLEQTVTCWGDSEAFYELSTSPTESRITTVSNMLKEIAQSIETADGGVITKILDTDGTWKELVIANNQDLSQATSVWRWNINGLAHSTQYSGGTYSFALDDQGRLIANVIQTGILQDANGDNSWNLDTGAFTITNGSINITTNSSTYDVIKFQNNEWYNAFSPLEYRIWNSTTQKAIIMQAGGMWFYDNYDGNGNETDRVYIDQNGITTFNGNFINQYKGGKLRQYDTSGNVRTYLEYGDIYLYAANGTLQTHLNSQGQAEFSNTSGTRTIYLDGSTGQIYPLASANYIADFVIEAGTYNSWTYRKWNSGWYECWQMFSPSIAVNNAWGNWAYGAVARQAYPVTFSSAPHEIASLTGSYGWAVLGCGDYSPSTTQTGQYYLFRPSNETASARTYNIVIYARGVV